MKYTFEAADRAHMLGLLEALVRCETENVPPYGHEAAGQDRICAEYRDMGLEIDQFTPAEVKEYPENPEFMPRNFENRKNTLGIWHGTGGGRSLLLTGHMDVVPKEPLPWTVTQPYEPLIKDGRMIGRGTADMKGGLAIAAAAVRKLKESGFCPKGDIVLESVVDEEFAGANGTIASRFRGYNTDFALVLEATGLNICPACVGGLVLKLSVKGIAGMPYTGEEISNPAYDISELVLLIRKFSDYRMQTAPKPPLWAGTVQGAQVVITKLRAGEAFEHGQLSAPIDAWMEIVMQSYPGETEEKLIGELKQFIDDNYADANGVTIERVYHYCRPAATDADHPGVRALARAAQPYTPLARVCGCMFSCDMFALTEIGHIPSAVFGPIGGRLHAPDEWIDLTSMEICVQSLMDFIVDWCG